MAISNNFSVGPFHLFVAAHLANLVAAQAPSDTAKYVESLPEKLFRPLLPFVQFANFCAHALWVFRPITQRRTLFRRSYLCAARTRASVCRWRRWTRARWYNPRSRRRKLMPSIVLQLLPQFFAFPHEVIAHNLFLNCGQWQHFVRSSPRWESIYEESGSLLLLYGKLSGTAREPFVNAWVVRYISVP